MRLVDFQDRLRLANNLATSVIHIDTAGIQGEIRKLKKWLGAERELRATSNQMQTALLEFRNCGRAEQPSFSNLRLICNAAGTILPVGGRSFCLLEESDLFGLLLQYVGCFGEQPRLFRRLFRGLLNCYFSSDPDEVPRQSQMWEVLRNFLRENLSKLGTGTVQPRWVDTIQDHNNLLEMDPCIRYGRDLLNGNDAQFKTIELELGIGGSSWIARKIVWSHVRAAAELEDARFAQVVPSILEMIELGKHASLRDQCLAALLERHCARSANAPNVALFTFAVRYWQNPWLPTNIAKWGRVSSTVKNAISAWLKLDLIQQFFEMLANDGNGDRRRLDFWIQYHDVMGDMYFALGSYARKHASKEFRELRSKLFGCELYLTGAGSPDNNAFMMCFGDYVVVEFGNPGNACYVYRRSNGLPFALEWKKEVLAKQLKDKSRIDWLQHKDNVRGFATWEERFESELYIEYRIRPSLEALPAPWRTGKCYSTCTANTLAAFCEAFGLSYSDNREGGGIALVTVSGKHELAEKQLRTWGFLVGREKNSYPFTPPVENTGHLALHRISYGE